jgi:hypothetical protein
VNGYEEHLFTSGLIAGESVVAYLLNVPNSHPIIRYGEIGNELYALVGLICVLVKSTATGHHELHVDAVPL